MPNESCKKYLGDGVYAQMVDGMILLTTENGLEATNEIYLDMEVTEAKTNRLRGVT